MSSTKILTYMGEAGPLTGAPRRLLTLVNGLRDRGFEVIVSTHSDSDLYRIEKESNFLPIDIQPKGVLALKNKQLIKNRSLIFRLKVISALIESNMEFYEIIKKNKIDLVWLRGSGTFAKFGLALFFSKTRVIWDLDDEMPSDGIVRILHELAMFMSIRIVSQYESTFRKTFNVSLNRRYQHRYETIIPGIDLFRLECKNQDKVRNCIKIIQIGTVCERKNQIFTLKVLGKIKENYPDLNFNIDFAGFFKDAQYKSKVDALIEAYNLNEHVTFLGWCNNITQLTAQSDIVLMPSFSEGVPNAVQEAMAIGLPVVASKAGGLPEIIVSGKTGFCIDLDLIDEWYDIILRLIQNSSLRQTIGVNAKNYAAENFDNRKWVSEYIKVINSVTER